MYLNLSTDLTFKRNATCTPMDFKKLTLDGLIDIGALTSVISGADLNKIDFLSKEAIKDKGPASNFQIMVANGQLERPIETVLLEFEVADFQCHCNEDTTKPIHWLVLLTKAQRSFRHSTRDHNISIIVNAITPRTHNKYPSSNTFADKNYLYPSTWGNPRNLQQNATLDRPQCNRNCYTVFTYGRT